MTATSYGNRRATRDPDGKVRNSSDVRRRRFAYDFPADDLFNVLDAEVSDIDYYFASRLPREPLEGIEDVHSHPALPRTLRVSLSISM